MTIRACVTGFPVAHSRSPMIHGFWLAEHGIDGSYDRAEVKAEDFAGHLATLAARGYAGGNVTVPHKEAAFRLADVDDRVARSLGAVNTLWFEGGRLRGSNTDVAGFLANLDASAPGWDASGGKAVVLGAGGAARAIVYALLDRGADPVFVVNRTRERAEALAQQFGPQVRTLGWDEAGEALAGAKILVNTTSLGMTGQPVLDLELGRLPQDALVTDIVYVPLETPLLARARAAGFRSVDGLGMLLHQAVPGFARWFGVRPAVSQALRDLVVADIEGGRRTS